MKGEEERGVVIDWPLLHAKQVDERSRKFDSLLPPLGNTARLRPLQKHTSSLIVSGTLVLL